MGFDVAEYSKNRKKKTESNENKSSGFDVASYYLQKSAPSAGDDINTRLNNLLSSGNNIANKYNERYSGDNTSYRSDSSSWLSNITSEKNKFDSESYEIRKLLNQYRDYFDSDYVSNVEEALSGGSSLYQSMLKTATDENKYWSQFGSEDEYNKYEEYRKTREEMLSYDTKAGEEEVKSIKDRLSDYNSAKSELENLKKSMTYHYPGTNNEYVPARIAELEETLSGYGDIESDYASKNAYLIEAKNLQKENKLREDAQKAEDYDAMVSRGNEMGTEVELRIGGSGYKNDIVGWRNTRNPVKVNGNSPSYIDYDFANAMTEDEVNAYSYYLAKYGRDKADEYLETIRDDVNRRVASDTYEKLKDNTFAELVFAAHAGLDQSASGLKNLVNFNDDYIPVSATQYASGMIREDLSGVSGFAYDLIQTTSNMIPSILASTISNAILPGSGAAVGAVTLGGSAAGNAYQEMLNLGYDKSQARVYSTLTGISEAGLQYALGGISKLGGKLTGNAIKSFSQGINSAAAKFAIEFGGEMISEGTEEFLQDVLDPFFKSIATGEKPEDIDWGQAAYSGFLGALSAGLLNSVDVTANKASDLSSARRIINDGKVDSLKNVANTFSADTVAYKLAGKVNEKTGAWKISQLLHEVNANLSEQNQADIKYNLMRTGMTEADSESVSKWLAKAVNGQNFTSLQRKALDNNPIISRVFKKVIIDSNSTVNQRIKGMMDVRGEEGSVGIDYAAIAKAQKNNNLSKSATESLAINQSIQDTLNKNAKRMFKTDRQTSYDSMIDDMVSDLVKRKNTMSDSTAVKDVSEKVSDTNNTVISSTGESVTIKKIKSINKGNMELELSDGRVVSNNDIEYRSNDEALIYESVASMGYSAETANAIVNGYTALNGVSASQYVLGVNEGYNYGKIGYPMDKIDSNGFYADLTDTQKAFAYNLGRKAASVESETAQKILNNGKEKGNRKGKVHIASSISSMTERQKASLSTIGRVVADVTHNDVYVFESVEKDGKRVFSEDIAGHKAGESAPNGFYDQKTGAIYIDLHSGNNGEGVMLWTAAHELTHFIRQWSPAKFKALSDFLMEEYGNKGVSIQSLIQTQINKAKANGRTLTFDGAYEEVVADAMQTMFTDTNLSEKLEKLKKQDHSLWQKIKDFFADLYKRIAKAYEGLDPQTKEAKFVREMKDSIEKISDLFAEALTDAGETFRTTIANIDVNSESVSPVFSERTRTASEYVTEREKAAKEIAKAMGVSVAKAKAYIDDVNSIAKMIANDRARLDYQASSFGSAFVSNVEYGGSFDFTTLCKKRRIYTGTFSEIQKRLKDVALTPDDVLKIRNMLLDAHYEATCGLCYVEGSRANMGKFCQEFIKLYKRNNPNSWIPNMADVNTPDGVEQMRIKHPECYEQYEYFWNHYGKLSDSDPALFASQQKPKLYEARKEYKGEILSHFKNDSSVTKKNLNGGIRMQSFSDFEIVHLIDTMQIIMDMSRVGLAGQAYTKVPEFAQAFGATGLKINLSLITKGVDKDGKLIFDDREGMPHQTAFGLRDRYSKNVGTILVTFTDEQLMAAMADPRIDFIIPFHRSQWKKGQYSAMGLPKGTKDYTFMQNEKLIKQTYHDYKGRQVKDKATNYMPNEYWDFSKSGKENAEAYLQMCADNNKRPKFYKLLDYDGNGKYSLKKDGSTDGYWKLLIDFKMYDNDGVGSPQMPVTPTFSMDDAKTMLNEYEGGHGSYPVAYDVVDKFVEQYNSGKKNSEEKYSAIDSKGKNSKDRFNYSLREVTPVSPSSDNWERTLTTAEVKERFPGLWDVSADESDVRNPTQISGTVKSYRKVYDFLKEEGFKGTILDASSGLGYGTKSGIDEYGFYVEDIEPFPDSKYKPKYTDYSSLNKKYDVIISNAVLNVLPQDQRDALVVKMGELLNEGGRMFINVRGDDVRNASSKMAINDRLMEYYISQSGSYQKGFTKNELVSYLQDALGDGFYVKPISWFGKTSAIVTKVTYDSITDSNIIYSDRDSEGNVLSDGQKEFFKDSKVRDDDGNLLKVFHGTSENFTVFDRTKGRSTMDIQGSFFSPWEIDAKGYGENVRAFYLNIVNPASEGVAYKALNKFKGQNNAGVKAREYLESLGYDGVNNSNEEYIAFNSNQIKSVENINPSSDPDIRYSDRDPDSIDNRTLLANALESAAKNDIEKKYISQYQEKIDTINAEQNKLTEIRAKIKELSFAKGHRDADQIRKLQTEATKTANRINIFDKQLLKLEATKPLKAVLDREKALAKKKAEKASREALAAYRERSAQTQRDLMDRYQTRIKKSKEGRDKTELRHKILKKIKELNDLLLKGDKDHHVPLSLQKSTALALQAINMDTVNAEERLAKIRDKIAKSSNPDVIAKLQKTYDRIELQGENMATKLDALDRAYNDVKNSKDPIIANVYDEGIMQAIINLKDEVGNTPLREMSLSQLESVYDMYKMVLHTIRNANKSFKAEKRETITQLGEQVMEQVRSTGGSKKFSLKNLQWIKKFAWNNLKPVYAMKVIGSETLSNLFENVRAGEDTYAVDISEARQYFLDNVKKYNYNSWDFETRYDFKSRTGKDFSLSLQEIMSLYAYSKREQAGLHLQQGGFVFEDSEIVEKVNGIPVKYDVNIADAYNISPETLSEIIGKLTNEQIAFANDMQKYLEDMGAKGNEITRQMYDIDLFKEKNYFPLKSAKQFMFEQNEVAGEVKIKNSGFTKSTVPNANNPIILKGFMDVWSEHVSDMAMYHSFVLPLEDFNRVFNYKTQSGSNVDTMSVKQAIQNAYGKQANDYIKQMLTDLNGGARSSVGSDVTNKLISLFKKGATFASLSVVIQQPSAMARAMAYLDPKYFSKTTLSSWNPKTHGEIWSEVKKYAPVAIIKEMGYFDTNMGKKTTEWITSLEYEGIKEKVAAIVKDSGYRDEILSKAPALADEFAWVHIWNAVKAEMADKNPALGVGSEDFLKACGKRFTEVVVNTQVYDSVLSRSALMRSKDTGVKMATAFMAEPTTSLNMIAYSLLAAKRSGKEGRAFARRQIGSVIASMILNSILVSVVYAARDDDDDKTYTEKYLGSLAGSLTDAVNPLSMIPFVRDIVSIVQGYDVERSDMAVISDLYNGWQSLFKDNVSAYDKVQKFAGSIANLFGIPLKNIMRDVKSLYNVAEGVISGDKTTGQGVWESVKENLPFGSDTANAESLYNAYVSGNETMIQRVKARYSDEAKAITALKGAIKSHYESGDIDNSTAERYLIEYCGLSDDDAFWQMDKWNYSAENGSSDGYSKYDDFYTAVETGKNIKSVISEYTDNGVEAKTLAAQITSHFKPIYINMTTAEKAKLKGYLLNAYALLGYDRSKKSKDIDNWAD